MKFKKANKRDLNKIADLEISSEYKWGMKKDAYINYFAIRKKCQGRGISKKSMMGVIALAKRKYSKTINLSVWAENFPAIALYTKNGFYVKEIKKKYYPNEDDKFIMVKELR